MKSFLPLLILLLFMVGCSESDAPLITVPTVDDPTSDTPASNPNCDRQIVIDDNLFDDPTADDFSIDLVEINDDCLNIRITGSGCDGESWEVQLLGSTGILDSNPVQRTVRLFLTNLEECDAVITKEFQFDLIPFQLSNENSFFLRFGQTDDVPLILYEY